MESAAIASANAAVQRYLTHREQRNAVQTAASLCHAQHRCSELFLTLRALRSLPHPDTEALQNSLQQATRFSQLLAPAQPSAAAASAAPSTGGGAAASAGAPAPPSKAAAAAEKVEASEKEEDKELVRKRALRDLLAAQLLQLGSVAGTLARDAEVLQSTARTHAELAEDAGVSGKLVRAWKAKEAADLRWVKAAAWLLILTAAYLALRRLLWAFLWLRLP